MNLLQGWLLGVCKEQQPVLSEVETPGLLGQVAAEGEGAQGRWQAGIDALSA